MGGQGVGAMGVQGWWGSRGGWGQGSRGWVWWGYEGVQGWWGSRGGWGSGQGGGGGQGVTEVGVQGSGGQGGDGCLGGPTFERRCCQDIGCFILSFLAELL